MKHRLNTENKNNDTKLFSFDLCSIRVSSVANVHLLFNPWLDGEISPLFLV